MSLKDINTWLPATLVTVVGGAAAFGVWSHQTQKKKDTEMKSPSKPRVYGFLPIEGKDADTSPACLKLMTFLKMTSTDFDVSYFPEHEMKKCPKGKVPCIHWDALNNGKIMSDSTLIINELVRVDPSKFDLDGHLSPKEKAIGTAFKTMLEESMYFAVVCIRWKSPEFERVTVPLYLSSIPAVLRWLVAKQIRGKLLRDLNGQGTGLLSDNEVMEKFLMELEAVSVHLGESKYFMGDKITSYDATVFAFMVGLTQGDWDHPISRAAKTKYANLRNYVNRMQNEFWPEYASSYAIL